MGLQSKFSELRKKKNINLEDISKRFNVPLSTLISYENSSIDMTLNSFEDVLDYMGYELNISEKETDLSKDVVNELGTENTTISYGSVFVVNRPGGIKDLIEESFKGKEFSVTTYSSLIDEFEEIFADIESKLPEFIYLEANIDSNMLKNMKIIIEGFPNVKFILSSADTSIPFLYFSARQNIVGKIKISDNGIIADMIGAIIELNSKSKSEDRVSLFKFNNIVDYLNLNNALNQIPNKIDAGYIASFANTDIKRELNVLMALSSSELLDYLKDLITSMATSRSVNCEKAIYNDDDKSYSEKTAKIRCVANNRFSLTYYRDRHKCKLFYKPQTKKFRLIIYDRGVNFDDALLYIDDDILRKLILLVLCVAKA